MRLWLHGFWLLLSASIAVGLMHTDIYRPLDRWLNDAVVRMIAKRSQPDADIVIVDIDDGSLQQLAGTLGQWPWPRSAHALLLEALHKAGARAVIFDLLMSEPDIYRQDSDAHLSEVLNATAPNFLAALLLPDNAALLPTPLKPIPPSMRLDPGGGVGKARLLLPVVGDLQRNPPGLINYSGDDDGVLRRYALWTDYKGTNLVSLPLQAARTLGWSSPRMRLWPVKYKGATPMPYPTVSYAALFGAILDGQPLPSFQDKWVIVGASASGLHDLRASPLFPMHPAVSLLATVLDNLKNNERLYPIAYPWPEAAAAMLAMLAVALGLRRSAFRTQLNQQVVLTVIVLGTTATLTWLAVLDDRLPNMGAAVGVVLTVQLFSLMASGLKETLRVQRITHLFGRFLDPRVVSQLVQAPESLRLTETRKSEITVLFSDIRGFTTLSETHSPEQVVQWLNDYFSRQVEVIFRHGGTLDKFIGDAIMAFWGAPLSDKEQALHAVQAAVAMCTALEAFRQTLPEQLRGFDIGIGIHSGPAVVGMIGSQRRMDYTAIGDTVNLASRIEGLTKNHGRILFSEATRQQLPKDYPVRQVGTFEVKGRKEAVTLYEPNPLQRHQHNPPRSEATEEENHETS